MNTLYSLWRQAVALSALFTGLVLILWIGHATIRSGSQFDSGLAWAEEPPAAPTIKIDLRRLSIDDLKRELTKHVVGKDEKALFDWLRANKVDVRISYDLDFPQLGNSKPYQIVGIKPENVDSYWQATFSEAQVNPGFLLRGTTWVVFVVSTDRKVAGFVVVGGRNSS